MLPFLIIKTNMLLELNATNTTALTMPVGLLYMDNDRYFRLDIDRYFQGIGVERSAWSLLDGY